MPQLSLYIDQDTLKAVESAAKAEKTSVSKWVVARLRRSIHRTWPADYERLFGAIEDPTFTVGPLQEFSADAQREKL